MKTAADFKTVICCNPRKITSDKAKRLEQAGVHLIALGEQGTIAASLGRGFEDHGWSNVLVEAGGGLVGRLAAEHLVNEVLTMIAPTILGDPTGVTPFRGRTTQRISDGLALEPVDLRVRDSEFMGWYRTPDVVTER